MSRRSRLLLAQALLVALVFSPRIGSGAVVLAGDHFIGDGNSLFVGDPGLGSAVFTPGGAPDTYSFIGIGNNFGTNATGSVTISGAGALVTTTNALNVGGLSNGIMLIQNGGVFTSLGGASPFSG